jgi:SAM-dependent methyltransferase
LKRQAWHTRLFDDLNKYWAEIADARHTEKEVEFIEGVAAKTRGLILDLCCGTGRHSIRLHNRGWDILGLDISPKLLKIARERRTEEYDYLPLVRAEMRHLPFRSETFGLVINMFTSFGYLPSERVDMLSLKEVARSLKRDGLFLLDVVNREHLRSAFKKKDWGEFRSFYMLEKRMLNAEESKLSSEWTLIDRKSGKVRTFEHNLRLYTFPQLQKMLEKAELTVVKVYGDYEGREFNQESPRLIVLAKK